MLELRFHIAVTGKSPHSQAAFQQLAAAYKARARSNRTEVGGIEPSTNGGEIASLLESAAWLHGSKRRLPATQQKACDFIDQDLGTMRRRHHLPSQREPCHLRFSALRQV